MSIEMWDWALRLSLAALLGALVGMERESRGHPAGIRTQALVALAAALFTGVGIDGFAGIGVDTSRVASQVASGIGFIGAGVILKNRGSIKGLTTAATLFLSAALGVAVGAGLIYPAIFSAVVAIVIVYGLRMVKPMVRRSGLTTVQVDYLRGHGTIGPLLRTLQEAGYSIEDLEIDDDTGESPLRHVRLEVFGGDGEDVEEIVRSAIGERTEVERILVEALRETTHSKCWPLISTIIGPAPLPVDLYRGGWRERILIPDGRRSSPVWLTRSKQMIARLEKCAEFSACAGALRSAH